MVPCIDSASLSEASQLVRRLMGSDVKFEHMSERRCDVVDMLEVSLFVFVAVRWE